jgi:hypothetical protein
MQEKADILSVLDAGRVEILMLLIAGIQRR